MADNDSNVIDASAVFAAGASESAEPEGETARNISNIEALAHADGEEKSTAARIVEMAADMELFRDDDVPYGSVLIGGKRETWRIGARAIRNFLSHRYHRQVGKVPGDQALRDALRVLEGKALYEGLERKVHVRIARCANGSYLDLADEERRVIEIDANGWRFVTDPPVRFVRPRGLMPLPAPARGGSVDDLRPFVNIRGMSNWRLTLAWLVSAFFPGPYTFLALCGAQGSAKTSTSRYLRQVIDPNRSDVRAQPRNIQDLVIGASKSTFIVLDNISFIDDWLSDALCRMSTGGGFATRELFTDDDEVIIDVQRPGILNGITDIVSRGDLLERSVLIDLPPIPPDERRTEREMKIEFARTWPSILGTVLDAVSGVLRHVGGVSIRHLPRMADFAIIGSALERALGWPSNSFMDAYEEAISAAHDVALDVSVVAPHVRTLASSGWEGTASELLARLNDMFDGRWPRPSPLNDGPYKSKLRPKGWPGSPVVLSRQLKRLEPNLLASGIVVSFTQTHGCDSRKLITLRRVNGTVPPPAPAPMVRPEVMSPVTTIPTTSPTSMWGQIMPGAPGSEAAQAGAPVMAAAGAGEMDDHLQEDEDDDAGE